MKKIYINSLLSEGLGGYSFVQNSNSEVELDFSNVEEIRLDDIQRLLDFQKMAVFNEIKMKSENMRPNISRIFEQTGLSRVLNTFGATVEGKINKRQGLALE